MAHGVSNEELLEFLWWRAAMDKHGHLWWKTADFIYSNMYLPACAADGNKHDTLLWEMHELAVIRGDYCSDVGDWPINKAAI